MKDLVQTMKNSWIFYDIILFKENQIYFSVTDSCKPTPMSVTGSLYASTEPVVLMDTKAHTCINQPSTSVRRLEIDAARPTCQGNSNFNVSITGEGLICNEPYVTVSFTDHTQLSDTCDACVYQQCKMINTKIDNKCNHIICQYQCTSGKKVADQIDIKVQVDNVWLQQWKFCDITFEWIGKVGMVWHGHTIHYVHWQ